MLAASFRFSSGKTANRLVAGVPAAARLAHSFALALPGEILVLSVGNGGTLNMLTMAEIERLAPKLDVQITDELHDGMIPGETLPDAGAVTAIREGHAPAPLPFDDPDRALHHAERVIIRATGKPGDGLISRNLNRPLSQAVSALLLRCGWIRPGHGTALTFLVAVAMVVCLLTGTPSGLVGGAILFQVASVVDGIDGEIARATFRSSARGASLDSITDAFTNCAFFVGTGINYLMQDRATDATVSFAAALIMATGLVLLGWRAARRTGYIHFDSIKQSDLANGKPGSSSLKDLTSRDFYCFFLLLMALADLLASALRVFLIAVTVWLLVLLQILGRRS